MPTAYPRRQTGARRRRHHLRRLRSHLRTRRVTPATELLRCWLPSPEPTRSRGRGRTPNTQPPNGAPAMTSTPVDINAYANITAFRAAAEHEFLCDWVANEHLGGHDWCPTVLEPG